MLKSLLPKTQDQFEDADEAEPDPENEWEGNEDWRKDDGYDYDAQEDHSEMRVQDMYGLHKVKILVNETDALLKQEYEVK